MIDSAAVQPRGMILIDGATVPQAHVAWEIDSNTHYQADTFRADLVLSETPALSLQDQLQYWSTIETGRIELLGGFPQNPDSFSESDLTSFLIGQIDEIDISPFENKVALYGRDLTSSLLDTKTSEKFQNQTASQIAAVLAKRHGLQAQITPTTTISGTYYQIDHVELQSERTEWDLLTYLADKEGFDVFVQGETLYFQPRDVAGTPYELTVVMPGASPIIASNCISLNFKRTLTLSGGVKVIVRSWNQKQKAGFTKEFTAHRAKNPLNPPKGNRPPQVYTYNIPNLTADQAQQRANEIAKTISEHEILIEAELPGDAVLTPRMPVAVKGTGTALDDTYFPDSVQRSLNFDEGFSMTLRAKNHAVESTVDA